ncbi:MAG TPA: O-antigen translocase [Verrucomicrobiae bacterium]|nr:O-antigen translocase [Verrucomicrobiae bacterium]
MSHGQILKSSAIIGGSSLVNAGLGIIRTKVMAILLGPAGFGLLGVYGSISDLTRTVAGLGINSSGVRQIAEAVGSGDAQRIARTITTLRRVAFYSGALGALLLLAFSKPVSWLTFKDAQHTGSVALLALAVFFGDVSAGQSALVQGMRRISDLARMSIWGALYGTIFSVVIVYFFGERGVAPSLVCVAAMGILTSWWYARKIKVESVALTVRQIMDEASELVKLGVVFMASGFMTMGSAYLVRIILLHKIDLEAVGFYQAAWVLGGFYIGYIVQAMGADFYPRLAGAANDNAESNRLVNEQIETGLLLAAPGAMATLTFAPLVMQLFYSDKFGPSVEVFRWICLGMMIRVASWPVGFVLVARGKRGLFFWAELLSNLISVIFAWVGVQMFGLNGAGIAFFGLYVLNAVGVYWIVRRLTGFRWSAANRRLGFLFAPLTAAVFVGHYVFSDLMSAIFGGAITLLVGIYSVKVLCTLIPLERLSKPARKIILFLRLATPNNNHKVADSSNP